MAKYDAFSLRKNVISVSRELFKILEKPAKFKCDCNQGDATFRMLREDPADDGENQENEEMSGEEEEADEEEEA